MAVSSAHVRLPRKTIILGGLVPDQGRKMGKSLYRTGKAERHAGLQAEREGSQKSRVCRSVSKAGFEIGVPGCSDCVGVS
jgi:hypothetical protein